MRRASRERESTPNGRKATAPETAARGEAISTWQAPPRSALRLAGPWCGASHSTRLRSLPVRVQVRDPDRNVPARQLRAVRPLGRIVLGDEPPGGDIAQL